MGSPLVIVQCFDTRKNAAYYLAFAYGRMDIRYLRDQALVFGAKLDRRYPHVDIVDGLVSKAIARLHGNDAMAATVLENSGLVHQLGRSHDVTCFQWESMEERILDYLGSTHARFEEYHEDWTVGQL